MRSNIIFLDIDGVLNTEEFRDKADNYFDRPIAPENMRFLETLVKTTNSKIVLSSSWREYWDEGAIQPDVAGEYLNEIFAEYGLSIYSKTPDFIGNQRNKEIEAWINIHKNEINNYVILDDVDYDFDRHFFVMTDDKDGLNESTVQKAIAILTGKN